MTQSREGQFQRRERRVLRPFPISERALSECQFALDVDREFERTERHYVDAIVLEAGIRPKFRLGFDTERFKAEAERSPDDMGIAIVARDLGRRDYQVLQRFSVGDLPSSWQTPKPLRSAEGMDFQVVAYLKDSHHQTPGRAWRRGSVTARTSFAVKALVPQFTFPIESAAFDNDDLWRIQWQPEPDFDEPTESLLELWVNDQAYENLRLLSEGSAAGSLLARLIAAEVFEAVSRRVLAEHKFDPDNANENGLANVVVSKLHEVTGLQPEALRNYAENSDFLRSAAQRACALVEAVNAIAPRRA